MYFCIKAYGIPPVVMLYVDNCFGFITLAIPEDALNDESGEEEDKENPDERISSKFGLAVIF